MSIAGMRTMQHYWYCTVRNVDVSANTSDVKHSLLVQPVLFLLTLYAQLWGTTDLSVIQTRLKSMESIVAGNSCLGKPCELCCSSSCRLVQRCVSL